MRSIVVSIVAVLTCVSFLCADLREPRPFEGKEEIGPKSVRSYPGNFRPNELAKVIVGGTGKSVLGLYVYDWDGNCVAWDDVGRWNDPMAAQFSDELGLEWIADATGRYTVEVRSGGLSNATYAIAIRSFGRSPWVALE